MSKKNVRNYSFEILYSIFYDGKLLNNAINDTFSENELSDEDKSFIKKECTGVIEKFDDIDDIINKYSKVKTNKLKKDVLVVLRLGTYEMLYMDKVPDYATVSECVNIIKASKYNKLSGYVNAVLKNISKSESSFKTGNDKKYAYFRICNGGEEIVLKELNDKHIEYHRYSGSLKFNHSKIYFVDKYKDILDLDSFKKGYLLIMDASSAYLSDSLYEVLSSSLDDNLSLKILDTCSSPGGKILALNDILNDKSITCKCDARDISELKIDKIKENIERLQFKNIDARVQDATVLNSDDIEKYDVVICDVPCSGLGVISKKPDIKLNFSKEKLESLVALQRNILEVSKQYVVKGGILSYSTCTETIDENEENIKYFINNNSDFKLLYEKQIIHGDDNNSDGFYICIMKRV